MSIFNKINDALIVDIFKNVFQERADEVFLADVLKIRTVHEYVLHSERNITRSACWLVFTGEEERMRQTAVTNFQSINNYSFAA